MNNKKDQIMILYEKYNILNEAREKIGKYSHTFLYAIEKTEGSVEEKRLSAQIIQKFIKHFPSLQENALMALQLLCIDKDETVRIAAIKSLSLICWSCEPFIKKIVGYLAELIGHEVEFNTTNTNLIQIYRKYPLQTVEGVIQTIDDCTVAENRERIVEYLYKTLTKIDEKLNSEITKQLIQAGKELISVSSATEFMIVMPYLVQKVTKNQKELVDLTEERTEINKEFDLLSDSDLYAEKILMCVETILPLFTTVPSTSFVLYYCDQILPQWKEVGDSRGKIMQYHFAKQLAEMSAFCNTLEQPEEQIKPVLNLLKLYMPVQPCDGPLKTIPNLELTLVESFLYAFCMLGKQCSKFSNFLDEEFKLRLEFFSEAVEGCKRSLQKKIKEIKDTNDERYEIATIVLDNITVLIKDLLQSKPTFSYNIRLSFKSVQNKTVSPPKRHVPITFNNRGPRPKLKKSIQL